MGISIVTYKLISANKLPGSTVIECFQCAQPQVVKTFVQSLVQSRKVFSTGVVVAKLRWTSVTFKKKKKKNLS